MDKHETFKSTLSSKGQIVLPRDLREACGVHAGTQFLIKLEKDGSFRLTPKKVGLSALVGMGKHHAQSREVPDEEAVGAYLLDQDNLTRPSRPNRKTK